MNAQGTTPDFAALADDGTTLVIQRWLPGPLSRVWAYLTEADKRARWLADGAMEQRPGAALELIWRNDRLADAGDTRPEGFSEESRMQTQVLACEPMTRLSFGWGAGAVTFDLVERNGRVLLTLTHTGLDAASRLGIAAGWHAHLDILRARVAGVEAPSFWSHWTTLHAQYAARIAP
ncbi:MAG: SRPBCC family protein [Rhodobacteraceae bacterium]|nr:SRPBCC family protein [Paracoccaceae bacterium]